MRKRLAVLMGLLAALTFGFTGSAQAATNGSHTTAFDFSVGGTYFTGTAYYHNSGIGGSGANYMTVDRFTWSTNPGAELDRITIYGDTSGNNTYPTPMVILDTQGNSGQNDVPGFGDRYAGTTVDGIYMYSQQTFFDEGTHLWFEVCVTGGVGDSGAHVCVKHPSN